MREYFDGYMAKEAFKASDHAGTIAGAGLGGVAGGLLSNRKKLLRDIILGSALGGGAGFVIDQFRKSPSASPRTRGIKPPAGADALAHHPHMEELGGVNKTVDKSVEDLDAVRRKYVEDSVAKAQSAAEAGDDKSAASHMEHARDMAARDIGAEMAEVKKNTRGPGYWDNFYSRGGGDWLDVASRNLNPVQVVTSATRKGLDSEFPELSLQGVAHLMNPLHQFGYLSGLGMRGAQEIPSTASSIWRDLKRDWSSRRHRVDNRGGSKQSE